MQKSKIKDFKFTVFTPCYNGEETIKRVFDSMESQTYTNFEWFIVNDGSKDKSDCVIRELYERSPIKDKIHYVTQENMGKHRTWNWVVDSAQSDLFIPADCDDTFKACTLAYFNEKANEIACDGILSTSRFSGINVCCFHPHNGMVVGDLYPQDGLVSDNLELTYKYRVTGEHWGCIRTDLLKIYKFPEVKGRFFCESKLWYGLALDGFKVLCCNKLLRGYYYELESLSNNRAYCFDPVLWRNMLSYHAWLISKAWLRISAYDRKTGFQLLKEPIKDVAKIILGTIQWIGGR